MLLCLGVRYPPLLALAIALIVKEAVSACAYVYTVRHTRQVAGAAWHGKALTVLLYATMLLHFFWDGVPMALTIALTAVCASLLLASAFLYFRRSRAALRETKQCGQPAQKGPQDSAFETARHGS